MECGATSVFFFGYRVVFPPMVHRIPVKQVLDNTRVEDVERDFSYPPLQPYSSRTCTRETAIFEPALSFGSCNRQDVFDLSGMIGRLAMSSSSVETASDVERNAVFEASGKSACPDV